MADQDREFFEALAKARYLSKRRAGKSKIRSDGSKCSVENDLQSVAAEYHAAQFLHCPFNAAIHETGDGGSDFSFNIKVEAIWLGADKHTGKPRTDGHLIVNPHEPQRWADIYISVQGSVETGFRILGWITHKKLITMPMIDFGFGDRFACPVEKLFKGDLRKFKKDL